MVQFQGNKNQRQQCSLNPQAVAADLGLDRPATGRENRINHLKSTYHGFKGAGLQEKK
jgi:hypothetical protein